MKRKLWAFFRAHRLLRRVALCIMVALWWTCILPLALGEALKEAYVAVLGEWPEFRRWFIEAWR